MNRRTVTAVTASVGLAFACLASTPAIAQTAVAQSYSAPSFYEQSSVKIAEMRAAHAYVQTQERYQYAGTLVQGAVTVLKAIPIIHRREAAARRAAALAARQQPATSSVHVVSYSGGGVWACISGYESGNGTPGSADWSINTGNGFYGGLQFTEQSWLGYGGGSYAQYANEATPSQQIAVAVKLQAAQGWGAWPVSSVKCGV